VDLWITFLFGGGCRQNRQNSIVDKSVDNSDAVPPPNRCLEVIVAALFYRSPGKKPSFRQKKTAVSEKSDRYRRLQCSSVIPRPRRQRADAYRLSAENLENLCL
jgi:hypothetical protein